VYKRQIYQIAESNRIETFLPDLECSTVQAPGSVIVLIATHVDKLRGGADDGGGSVLQQRLQDIMYSVKDAECRAVENVKAELHALQYV